MDFSGIYEDFLASPQNTYNYVGPAPAPVNT